MRLRRPGPVRNLPDRPFVRAGGRVLATGLAAPWELTRGPDGWLWVTEKVGKRVDRINPVDGTRTVALTIDEVAASGAQDGLLGLALAGDAALVAYTDNAVPPPGEDPRGKIVRYHRDPGGTLSAPATRLYLATDRLAGPQSGSHTGTLANPGSVLEFPLTGLTTGGG